MKWIVSESPNKKKARWAWENCIRPLSQGQIHEDRSKIHMEKLSMCLCYNPIPL